MSNSPNKKFRCDVAEKVNRLKLDLITPAEEKQFREQGFLLLPSVISQNEVTVLLAEVERLITQANTNGTTFHEPYYHAQSYKLSRVLRLSKAFDALIDHPGYFGKLVSLLGAHIQLMGSEIFVRGTAQETITGFHTDSGAGMQQLLTPDENPFLQIKTQIFLTDLSEPYSSNFALIPGSHRHRSPDSNPLCMIDSVNCKIGAAGELPSEAWQVLAKPGDVLLFPHTLWHSVAPNRAGRTRYSISFRYGQLALRPMERFDPVLTDISRTLTARQRRLLGDLGEEDPSPYRPTNQNEIIYGEYASV